MTYRCDMGEIRKPYKVACRCGWEGMSSELQGPITQDEKFCPKCAAHFKRVTFGVGDGEDAMR